LKDLLEESGVDVSLISTGSEPTGHAIIQVNQSGENSIVIFGGANKALSEKDIDDALKIATPGDFILMQNETNCVAILLERAWRKGLFTVFNPAPMTGAVRNYPLDKVKLLIVNETEGKSLTGESAPADILASLLERYPHLRIVITLGSKGARYRDNKTEISIPAETIDRIVDTTAAGDTFIGYFLAELSRGSEIEDCLKMACRASAICIQKAGAADSIPKLNDVKHTILVGGTSD